MKRAPTAPAMPRPLAVLAGDATCLRSAARAWSGPSGRASLRSSPALLGSRNGTLAFLGRPLGPETPWPGGPLLWLLPERGPSVADLAILRTLLATHGEQVSAIVVVICFPADVSEREAAQDLEAIDDTLRFGIPPERPYTVSAVWLEQGPVPLGEWLERLR